jgi:hypothetical protein
MSGQPLVARFGGGSGGGNLGGLGNVIAIRFPIDTGAIQNSATSIPVGFRVLRTVVEITAPYDPGTTITVGRTGAPALLQDTPDNTPNLAADYAVDEDIDWGPTATPVRATIAGAPAAGAGFILVEFVEPLP